MAPERWCPSPEEVKIVPKGEKGIKGTDLLTLIKNAREGGIKTREVISEISRGASIRYAGELVAKVYAIDESSRFAERLQGLLTRASSLDYEKGKGHGELKKIYGEILKEIMSFREFGDHPKITKERAQRMTKDSEKMFGMKKCEEIKKNHPEASFFI